MSEDCQVDCEDVADILNNDTSCLEGCGGDISVLSVMECDPGELLLENSSLLNTVSVLRQQKADLEKQLDSSEEERHAAEQKVTNLQRDLKQFVEYKPYIQELIADKDEFQNQIFKLQKEIEGHLEQAKQLRGERDLYRKTISDLQDKFDEVCSQLHDKTAKYNELHKEFLLIEEMHEDCRDNLEKERESSAEKTRQIEELEVWKDRIDQDIQVYKEEILKLQEENNYYKLEHSIYQGGDLKTDDCKGSIGHELNIADKSLNSEHVQSPLCGTNFRMHRANLAGSYFVEAIKNSVPCAADIMSNNIPNKASCDGDKRASIHETSLQDAEIQTPIVKTLDCSSQTNRSPRDVFGVGDGAHCSQSCHSIAEENDVFFETSQQIADQLRQKDEELAELKLNVESLQRDLRQEKIASNQWKDLSLKHSAMVESLKCEPISEQDRVSLRPETKSTSNSESLDTSHSYNDSENHQEPNVGEFVDTDEHNLKQAPRQSRLLEALCLARPPPVTVNITSTRQLHGQEVLRKHSEKEDLRRLREFLQSCDYDESTYTGRVNMLNLCHGISARALSKKCGDLAKLMTYSGTDSSVNTVENPHVEEAIKLIKALTAKVGMVHKAMGTEREDDEMKAGKVMEVVPVTDSDSSLQDSLSTFDQLSNVDVCLPESEKRNVNRLQKFICRPGFPTWVCPTKFQAMVILFVACIILTMRVEVYRVPSVI